MGFYGVGRFTVVVRAIVPNHEFVIVANRSEDVFVKNVPSNIFHDRGMSVEDALSGEGASRSGAGRHIPQAHCSVVGSREQMSSDVGVPRESVSFLGVASETELWTTGVVVARNRRMLGVVENEDVIAWRLGSNQVRVLRHVTSTVNFSFVVHLDLYIDFPGDGSEATELAAVIVVLRSVELSFIGWHKKLCNDEMVLFVGSVSTED